VLHASYSRLIPIELSSGSGRVMQTTKQDSVERAPSRDKFT